MTEAPKSPVRVLVVEDSFPVADSLRVFLESEGFAVEIVGNLRRAMAAAEKQGFDIAVLDILLGADSVEPVAAKLQSSGIPMIYLSGFADAALLPEGLRGHPRLDKPCDPTLLVTTIGDVLAARRQSQ
jgi:DNA-binding response OmpR family regulator